MFSGCGAYSTIKDLKDLSFHRTSAFYRHAGPKGPEEVFFARVERSRGTGPRATGQEKALLSMRRSGAGNAKKLDISSQIAYNTQNTFHKRGRLTWQNELKWD